jgi:hypothetical protein
VANFPSVKQISTKKNTTCEISDFCIKVDENCALLGYYAACMWWQFLTDISGQLIGSLVLEDGTFRLFQNISQELPLHAA